MPDRKPRRHLLLPEDILDRAKTLAPLATYTAITVDALEEWIEKRQLKADVDVPKA